MSDMGAFTREEASMTEVSMIGIDPEKRSFHLHGVRADGSVAFRKQASRGRVLAELSSHPRCVAAMEACASAQDRGREVSAPGREVRLVPPACVKLFVKRQKSDAAGAEAICEAASRPTMRFVAVKSAERQAHGVVFRTRDLPVRQRTQAIDALRGHLAEFGLVAPRGPAPAVRLAREAAAAETARPVRWRRLRGSWPCCGRGGRKRGSCCGPFRGSRARNRWRGAKRTTSITCSA